MNARTSDGRAVKHHSGDHGSLNRLAFSATVHCLTGCSIGEVLGMVIGAALGWGNWSTVPLVILLESGQ
ncbi:MAG: DUF4396 domain-containing protein [Gammaproteobacteria bacterium]|nr:DUF4396 domain-containing protein [Gammaproteobacteria bacterium]